ncbi:MAG: hypothetical protein ABI417_19330, partial [Coleofasciculaceae cyanobacterium]
MTMRLIDGNITKSLSDLLSKRTFEKNDFLDATPMKTVLIVEDDPINARVFSKILIKRGGLDVKHTEDV